jgi:hypothetical protein
VLSFSPRDETLDLVISNFRNSGTESSQPFVRTREAIKDRPCRIFRNTRRMVFHAAAILTIAQDCTISTPCETLSVFMGHAMLLAYIKLSPFEEHESRAASTKNFRPDDILWIRGPEAVKHVGPWIETGGPASLGDVADICERGGFSEAKQGGFDALERCIIWVLARNLGQTISKFV